MTTFGSLIDYPPMQYSEYNI